MQKVVIQCSTRLAHLSWSDSSPAGKEPCFILPLL
jgi:hypothetical protein